MNWFVLIPISGALLFVLFAVLASVQWSSRFVGGVWDATDGGIGGNQVLVDRIRFEVDRLQRSSGIRFFVKLVPSILVQGRRLRGMSSQFRKFPWSPREYLVTLSVEIVRDQEEILRVLKHEVREHLVIHSQSGDWNREHTRV